MDQLSFTNVMVALAAGSFVILVGLAVAYALTQIRANAAPRVQDILNALLPWVYKAIIAGEVIAADALDETGRDLDGLDKAAIANSLYNLLPNTITVGGRTLDIVFIKHIITLEMWTAFVKQNFDEVKAMIVSARDYLRKQIPPEVPAALSFQSSQTFDETQAAA